MSTKGAEIGERLESFPPEPVADSVSATGITLASGDYVLLQLHEVKPGDAASLSEADLARHYNTIEALKAHPRLAKFITWVVRRPPDFRSRTPGGRRRRL